MTKGSELFNLKGDHERNGSDMLRFAEIRKKAEHRKGGTKALKDLLPEIKSAGELKRIPDDRWLSKMTQCVFNAGFNWTVIENKWDGFEAAFGGFAPGPLSLMSDEDIDGLLKNPGIVRNAQKITAVRHNAGLMVDLAEEHGTAANFFAAWPDEDFVGLLEVLKKRGSRLGGNTGQYFLRFMGKDSFVFGKDVVAGLVAAGVGMRAVGKPPTSKTDLAAVQDAFNRWRAESGWPLAHISKTLACTVGD